MSAALAIPIYVRNGGSSLSFLRVLREVEQCRLVMWLEFVILALVSVCQELGVVAELDVS